WRTSQAQVACEARQHPPLREGSRTLHVRSGGRRADSVHGPGAGDSGEGCPRQVADGYLVAHDRADQWTGEDRLSDPEAAGDPATNRRRVLEAWRPGPGLL